MDLAPAEPVVAAPSGLAARLARLQQPLELDLPRATFLLLQQIGIVSSALPSSSSLLDRDHLSTPATRSLINTADANVLLSIIPSSLRQDLPSRKSAPPTAATRARVLDVLARLALEPSLTLPIMHRFRPLSAHLWGRWLELLGVDVTTGEFVPVDETRMETDGRDEERHAVAKVYRAMVAVVQVFENCFPFLQCLLRHPLLSLPPLPAPSSSAAELAGPLLTLHALLHALPHLASSSITTPLATAANPSPSPWSFPPSVEVIMKTHPHRGTRLLAWRILRKWYNLYAGVGEDLREQWVWKGVDRSGAGQGLAPMPPHPQHYKEEYESEFGSWNGADEEVDLLPGWGEFLAGSARFVEGGVQVDVLEKSVDVWLLPLMEDTRSREARDELRRVATIPVDWISEEQATAFTESKGTGVMLEHELSPMVVCVEGYLLFREGLISSSLSTSAPAPTPPVSASGPKAELFVRTPTTTIALRTLALHLQRRLPVLISSPPSAGKASVAQHLWSTLHCLPTGVTTEQARKRGLVVINLADRSLDSKSLLGSLSSAPATSDAEAGTFAFVEGPLTRAVRQGRWVVLTSIDQASVEVLTVIKVVAERMRRASESSIGGAWGGGTGEDDGGVGVRVGGGDGRWVRAGKGFMLFATRSVEAGTSTINFGRPADASFFAAHFFSEIWMPAPDQDEVAMIVEGRYPRLVVGGLGRRLIGVWDAAKSVVVREGGAGTGRAIGVRDLLRWCRRVEGLLPHDVEIRSIESNPVLQEEIYTEARDVFLGSLPLPPHTGVPLSEARDRYSVIAHVMAEGLSLSEERAEHVLRRRDPDCLVPQIDEEDGKVSTAQLFLKMGRVSLPFRRTRASHDSRPYALTKPSRIVLEKLAVCLRLSEPVLMVGETGTGKTAAVGHLAELMGKRLTALNLSNQTEAGDLIGGFRPIDEAAEAKRTASELFNQSLELMSKTQSHASYTAYKKQATTAFSATSEKKNWRKLVAHWRSAARVAIEKLAPKDSPPPVESDSTQALSDGPRKRRKVDPTLTSAWEEFIGAVEDFELRHVLKASKNKFVFSFVEGPLAKAIRSGDWVLLDEVNLASAETLESLSTLLQAPDSSLILTEQGDLEPIPRHPEFRLFACMNPATDVGKRDLPAGLRAKFSEIWVPPPDADREALVAIITGYIGRCAAGDLAVIANVADLYTSVKSLAISAQLADGSNQPPHYSMRTLARALTFASDFTSTFGIRRALYEGFLMSFTMLLDAKSSVLVKTLIEQNIVKGRLGAFTKDPRPPASIDPSQLIKFGSYWLETGPEPLEEPQEYILTPSVQAKVLDLARAVLTRKVPVLIQGPTSSGKTSVVEYLAKRTGHRFVRINNHEHTDIQEYIGTYVSDTTSGKLVFQEGVLVRALRRGDWIVLDELNLAPTDVLEALNRLLDDNRELVIPETGEVVRPHPHFMLFATQNPPGLYGGRKILSRAFRNRFLEMHFGDVPKDELETILCQRCQIAPSYAKKTVAVFLELQRRRQAGRVFEQKHAFATLRDLFRWGGRGSVGYQQLAEDGYMLLAERARKPEDKAVVKEVIELEMKVAIDEVTLYDFDRLAAAGLPAPPATAGLVWTSAMRRLYYLMAAGLHRNEPVLLVGETGSGKTSVCQSLALALGRQLHIVGCHQNTETADLLGGQRPLRNRAALQSALRHEAKDLLQSLDQPTPSESDDFEDIVSAIEDFEKVAAKPFKAGLIDIVERMRRTTALFEWHDGPLVQAMHAGDLILLDEISLADDSVLERLNSVLEPARTLVLAEKGGHDLDDIRVVGADGFQILATMNPGGDFGKKELSPALRNRFTEIWVPLVDDYEDLLQIIGSRWEHEALESYGPKILEFGRWFGEAVGMTSGLGIGLRDILAWVDFLNIAALKESSASLSPHRLEISDAFCQGALMTVVDGMGALPSTSGLSKEPLHRLREQCWRQLEHLVPATMSPEHISLEVVEVGDAFFIGPFGVTKGPLAPASAEFTLQAPTTRLNAMRLIRALQLTKPVLLEGSPGVGKTSLVTAIAAATGHNLVRINLSDQTDLMDLLGSDLPVEGGRSGEFAWKDAPFLAAMQEGAWVLLDEMNLASQSILEGLNSCLDHRGTVYIPELDRTFVRHPDFRIFAAQNPLGQGGGRKGLPKSFLDRFSLVHMEELNSTDLNSIAAALYPEVDAAILARMISFNTSIHRQSMESRAFGLEGAPWEFNLRDVLRWLSLLRKSSALDLRPGEAVEYAGLLYLQRFRTLRDREHVARLFSDAFAQDLSPADRPWPSIAPRAAQIGHSVVVRSDSLLVGRQSTSSPLLQRSLQPLEALIKCFDMGWLAILTGPRASGKTTLVRQLATLQGKSLREFSMNAEVDTLELLGSFEQAERYREHDRIAVDAIALLEDALCHQLVEPVVRDIHAALAVLVQLRLALSASGPELDLRAAGSTIALALTEAVGDAFDERRTELVARIDRAASSTAPSARFEWIDGPLVKAMKNGEWLLIEDANLCSPSVLDRLNSLFEPGGRLQLAERGPVDGEIQIIFPHKDFRLVMTLDPRHGELSRAMRNRGIEIAILDASVPTAEDSRRLCASARISEDTMASSEQLLEAASLFHADDLAPPPSSQSQLFSDSITEPGLAPIVAAVNLSLHSSDEASAALARHLIASIASSHFGLTVRFLRAVKLLDEGTTEAALRGMSRHSLVQQIDQIKDAVAVASGADASLLSLQPSDLALCPHSVSQDRQARLSLSPALDTLAALLLSSTANPASLRAVSSKPVKSLNVWEQSLLASHGRLRGDDADPAIRSLFPAMIALGGLITRILSVELSVLSVDDRDAAIRSATAVQLLSAELEQVCRTNELDFSSVQHIASWIAEAIQQVPLILVDLASDARQQLAPLQNSLILTTGKQMAAIWRSCLPYRPASDAIAETYNRLLARGVDSAGEIWDASVVSLFLDVAVTLGVPRAQDSEAHEAEAADLVERILLRLPSVPAESKAPDSALRLTNAANISSLSVTELAAVASVFGSTVEHVCAATLVRVAQASGVVPLSTIVPIHQLVSWPLSEPKVAQLRSSVEFRTLLGWSERLALGMDVDYQSADVPVTKSSPADIVRPTLLRTTVALRVSDLSSLGNLIKLSESLWRAAKLQTLTAAADSTSRVTGLRSALIAAIALMANACSLASDAAPGDTPASVDESEELCIKLVADRSSFTAAFDESVQLYLLPMLPALSPAADLASVGEGFVGYARSLWHLYVPNIPLDPAVGLRAHTKFLGRQVAVVTELYAAFEQSELRTAGNATNIKLDHLRTELSSLQQGLDTAGVLPVSREGDPALLAGLFRELRSFREQIVSDGQLDSLLAEVRAPWTPELASRESNLQYSVETLLRRLNAAYGQLDDILGPVRLSLCCLKIGLSLLLHVSRSTSLDAATSPFAVLLQDLASFPTVAHTASIQAVDLPLSIKAGAESPLPPSRATLLQVASLVSQLSTNSVFDRNALRRLTQLYDRMHYLWSADRRREEEAAREAESLYKAKTDIQQIASDEELEAQEFALLFPTFEDGTNEDTAPVADPATSNAKVPKLLQPSDQAALAKLHVGLFAGDAAFASACAADFDLLRGASITTLLPGLFDSMDESLDRASAAYRIRTLVELSQVAAPTTGIEAIQRDFYNEPDVRETAKAVPILLALSARLASLVETWPEQMVLQNLRERCEAVLSLSSKSSVANVLTAIEALLVHTEDWETYASKEHSIVIGRTAITNLIVEWRRLELTCWSRLLSTVQDRFGDPVATWWFRFYETTIRGAPGVDSDSEEAPLQTPAEYYRDLVSLLDSFLATSSLGQFGARLQLVLSFARLAARLGEEGPQIEAMEGAAALRTVSRLMLNIYGFYDQFSPRVKSFLHAERARIDKDVQNLIKLASWKDVNVYALKQSAIRSHHQLYKSVRKLRAVLQKPASDFFTIPEFDRSLTSFMTIPAMVESPTTAELPSIPDSLALSSDATHIVRLDQTLGRLQSLVASRIDPFVTLDRATLVDELAVQIITTSKALKAESVPGEEEGRVARVKALATRKRRAWIELLRELKRLGLSHTPSPETVARLHDSGFVYALPASQDLVHLDASLLLDSLRVQLVKADDYHFRLLSEMPALRRCPIEHNPDVSTREIQRAIGSFESCMALGFENRSQLLATSTAHVAFEAAVLRLEQVSTSVETQPRATSRSLAEALLDCVSQVIAALAETRQELANHRLALRIDTVEVGNVDTVVATAHGLLVRDQGQLVQALASMASAELVLSSPAELVVFESARKNLIQVADGLAAAVCPPSLAYLIAPLSTWINSLEVPVVRTALTVESLSIDGELAALKDSHTSLIDSVLVIAQELRKLADKDVPTDEGGDLPDLGIRLTGRTLQATLAVFRLCEVREQVNMLVVRAHAALASTDSIPTVAALLCRVTPFLRRYSTLVSRHLSAFLEWHKASLKLAYVLATVVKELSAEGFCRPSEDDGKGGEDSKTTDGTGMADGTGATNVSNEIEDEEQIEGLQGEVPKEDKQEQKDGDDDAVEMKDDFEGEMEDHGDGEEEDKDEDEKSDGEDQAEPEEQVADVDPLDPSSVDEKFWGDEESKDSGSNEEINQETTKSAGESEMAAKEDEAPAPKPKGEESGDAEAKEDEATDRPAPEDGEQMDGEDGDAGDDAADEEGKDEEGKDEEGKDGEEDEGDAAQQEDGQRLDERMPEADNLELPDDMQLDGDDKKEEDDLDLGDDMDDLEDGEDDGPPHDPEDTGDANEEITEDALPNEKFPEGEQPEAAPEDAPELDQSLGGADQGQTGGEGAQDSASSTIPESAAAEASVQLGAETEAEKGEDEEETAKEKEEADGPAEDKETMDDDADPSPTAPSNAADGQTKQRSSNSDPKSDPSRSKPNQPTPAEPQRSLGDALQSWRRRLEAIADLADAEPDQPETEKLAAGEEGEVEYVQDGDEKDEDAQALGPAKEEQVQGLDKLHIGEDDPQQSFEPDAMDVDDQSATLPPPTSAIQLDGSSLAESDAKAIPAAELRDDRTAAEADREDDAEMERVDDDELPSTTLAGPIDPTMDLEVEQQMLQWRCGDDDSLTADGVWRLYEALTRDLSYALTEQLRLILEPTLATRLKGDYRSGKRLNMKKIIPYIASDYSKDKIFLRRTRPSQREYQIMIAIDDSKSMADSHSVHLAYQSLALITRALTRLEVGGIAICRFGETMDVLHPFENGPVSDEAGARLLGQFTFSQRSTDVRLLVEKSLNYLALAKDRARANKSSLAAGDLWQLQIIISDGICSDQEKLRALLRRATDQKVMFVFIVVDSLHRRATDAGAAEDANQNSILSMQSVSYSKAADGRLTLQMERYLDSFPFEQFVVLRDADALPETLSATLSQFLERVSSDR